MHAVPPSDREWANNRLRRLYHEGRSWQGRRKIRRKREDFETIGPLKAGFVVTGSSVGGRWRVARKETDFNAEGERERQKRTQRVDRERKLQTRVTVAAGATEPSLRAAPPLGCLLWSLPAEPASRESAAQRVSSSR